MVQAAQGGTVSSVLLVLPHCRPSSRLAQLGELPNADADPQI